VPTKTIIKFKKSKNCHFNILLQLDSLQKKYGGKMELAIKKKDKKL